MAFTQGFPDLRKLLREAGAAFDVSKGEGHRAGGIGLHTAIIIAQKASQTKHVPGHFISLPRSTPFQFVYDHGGMLFR